MSPPGVGWLNPRDDKRRKRWGSGLSVSLPPLQYGVGGAGADTKHYYGVDSKTPGLLIYNIYVWVGPVCFLTSPGDYGTNFLQSCTRKYSDWIKYFSRTSVYQGCSTLANLPSYRRKTFQGKMHPGAGETAHWYRSCPNVHYGLGLRLSSTETGLGGTRCNPNTKEVEAGESKVQTHPQRHGVRG